MTIGTDTQFDDVEIGTPASEILRGFGGNDMLIDSAGGNDQLIGGGGDDQLTVNRSGALPTSLVELDGGDGNDSLLFTGPSGFRGDNATLDGGSGDDTITTIGGGSILILGGSGNDTINTMGASSLTINAGAGDDHIMMALGAAPTIVTLGTGSDTLTLDARSSRIGFTITDFDASDKIDLSAFLKANLTNWDGVTNPFTDGHLHLYQASDIVTSAPVIQLRVDFDGNYDADTGFNMITFQNVLSGSPLIPPDFNPVLGYDSHAASLAGIDATGTAGADTIDGTISADTIHGGSGDDHLFGDAGADTLYGGDGNDTIEGGDGSDTLYGEAGDDILIDNGMTADTLDGGSGNDQLIVTRSATANATIKSTATVSMIGGDGNDLLHFTTNVTIGGESNFYGGNGNDRIEISNNVATFSYHLNVDGGAGNDIILASSTAGGVMINGGDGADLIAVTLGGTGHADIQDGTGRDDIRLDVGDSRQTNNIFLDSGLDRDTITLSGKTLALDSTGQPAVTIDVGGFTGGATGDMIDVKPLLQAVAPTWSGTTNPFTDGYLSLSQWNWSSPGMSGSSASLMIDVTGSADGAQFQPFLSFEGIQGTITTENFGYTIDGSAPAGVIVTGSSGSDAIRDGLGNDRIDAGAGNDAIDAGFGNDILTGGYGSDALYGGPGEDTAVYAGLQRAYTTDMVQGFGTVSGGPEGGTDRLVSIETLQFSDSYVTTNPDSIAAEVARLYDTVLARGPDPYGLNAWVHQIEGGVSLASVAASIVSSSEFQTLTGALSTGDFVEYLYNHALDRPSDPGGKANWIALIDTGVMSRADVTLAFSESSEHRGMTADTVEQGFTIYDQDYAKIESLYDTMSNRLPEFDGLTSWTTALKTGALTIDQIATSFSNSAEFQSEIKGLSNTGIVELLYHNALGRDADPAGLSNWTHELDSGVPLGKVLAAFSASAEHQILLQPQFLHGMPYAEDHFADAHP